MSDPVDSLLDSMQKTEFDSVGAGLANLEDEELYEDNERPVDIIQFCEDPIFLGSQIKVDPEVMQLLWLIEQEGVNEAYVEVGKGSGKSFVGSIFPAYGVYLLMKMKEPQIYFGLAPPTIIATINVSIGRVQAKDVIFHQIKELVTRCPWFARNTKMVSLSQEVSFPDKNVTIYCGHSNSNAFLGFATVRAVLDEANFMVNNVNRT